MNVLFACKLSESASFKLVHSVLMEKNSFLDVKWLINCKHIGHKDWCTLIQTKRSSKTLLNLVRINVHQSLICAALGCVTSLIIKQMSLREMLGECTAINKQHYYCTAKPVLVMKTGIPCAYILTGKSCSLYRDPVHISGNLFSKRPLFFLYGIAV